VHCKFILRFGQQQAAKSAEPAHWPPRSNHGDTDQTCLPRTNLDAPLRRPQLVDQCRLADTRRTGDQQASCPVVKSVVEAASSFPISLSRPISLEGGNRRNGKSCSPKRNGPLLLPASIPCSRVSRAPGPPHSGNWSGSFSSRRMIMSDNSCGTQGFNSSAV
jgi:hypothetical protein